MTTKITTQQDIFPTAVNPQEDERPISLGKIRPELNLEKWTIFAPAHSKNKKARTITRTVSLPDGSVRTSKVSIDATERLGTLTTEEQKTYYALIKIWEEKGKPIDNISFSLRRVARTRGRKWGKRALDETVNEMRRLTGIPLEWSDSFFNKQTGETIDLLESFHIIDNLKIALKKRGDKIANREVGYFKFNDFILYNLLQNHTKPLLLDVVLGFKTELAQMLYTHLDLIMARRNHYERKTKELFDDLGLEGSSYRNPSNRKQLLMPALKELKGVRLTTGIITTATLERTKDDKDYKLVVRKGARMSVPVDEHSEDAFEHAAPKIGGEIVLEPQFTAPILSELTTPAKELVSYFFKRFHDVETSHPNSKAVSQASSLIARYGMEQACHIVDFAHRAAQETKFKIETFGGILQYTSRALADYESAKRREQAAQREREKQQQEREDERLWRQYEDYRAHELARLRATLPAVTLASIELSAVEKFEREDRNPFGRDTSRRNAIDKALEEYGKMLSFADWKDHRAAPAITQQLSQAVSDDVSYVV
jgi:hypothetical protein